MQRIKQGDEVIIITGKDKGKLSTVTKILENEKVLVSGVNTVKKHQRGNPSLGVAGGIVDKDMPIHISNVALYNPKTKKADRIGFRVSSSGKKERYFKSNNESV